MNSDTTQSPARCVQPACSALANVALAVCREQDKRQIWYGDPQLCQDIYARWGGTHTHPLNSISAVVSACARSKRWKHDGYISHLGRRYPIYSPNNRHQATASGKRR